MKYVLYSDLHIRPERLGDCEVVLNAVYEVARKHKAIVINGGDTFNTRGMIRTQCLDFLHRHYYKWSRNGIQQIILVGNHDQEDKVGDIHPHRVFKFDGWWVVDKPMVVQGLACFPYMPLDLIQQAIGKIVTSSSIDAVVHWGIMGAMRNDKNKDMDGVPVEWLKKFRNVFSGHYHYRNRIENVQYIGSPMQQNFGEMGQDKGMLLYDDKRGILEFIEIEGTKKHHEVEVTFNEKGKAHFPKIDAKPCDALRVKVKGGAEQCALIGKAALEKSYKDLDILVEREVVEKSYSRLRISASEVNNHRALAEKYVDFVDVDLDRARLMKVFQEVSSCP